MIGEISRTDLVSNHQFMPLFLGFNIENHYLYFKNEKTYFGEYFNFIEAFGIRIEIHQNLSHFFLLFMLCYP